MLEKSLHFGDTKRGIMDIAPETLERLLRAEDIEGFIALGSPKDEYASEAYEISVAISKLTSDELTDDTVLAIISLIWERNFELSPQKLQQRLPAIRNVVQQIILTVNTR